MKNFTLFVFLLLAVGVSGQSLTVNWVDRVGPYNVTANVTISGVPATGADLWMYWGDYGFPAWWFFYQEVPLQPGTTNMDIVFNTQSMGTNTGQYFDARYLFVNQSGNEIGTAGLLFQNSASFPPMYVDVDDVVGGFPPGITLSAQMPNGQYGAGRSYAEYQTDLRNDIWSLDYVWSNYRIFTQPIQASPVAVYNLPLLGGEFCFVWSATDSDISLDSHFSDVEVFRGDTLCFYWEGISTDLPECDRGESGLRIFPNPFVEVVMVQAPKAENFNLLDVAGRVISSGHLNEGENPLFMPGLPPGEYILRTEGGLSHRIIKQ